VKTRAEIEKELEIQATWDRLQQALQVKARAEKNAATAERLQSFLDELQAEGA
jgi:hypothetical protein